MLTTDQIETTRRLIVSAQHQARVAGWGPEIRNDEGWQDIDSLIGTLFSRAALTFYGHVDASNWEPGGPAYQELSDWVVTS